MGKRRENKEGRAFRKTVDKFGEADPRRRRRPRAAEPGRSKSADREESPVRAFEKYTIGQVEETAHAMDKEGASRLVEDQARPFKTNAMGLPHNRDAISCRLAAAALGCVPQRHEDERGDKAGDDHQDL